MELDSSDFKLDQDMLSEMYYVYVLLSEKDNKKYTGYTSNLDQRLKSHQDGKVPSTKNRRPLKLIYFEGCLDEKDARHRERYLKTRNGKMYLGNRLKSYLKAPPGRIVNGEKIRKK